MTGAQIITLITALTALLGAITGILHSIGTRRQLKSTVRAYRNRPVLRPPSNRSAP